MSTPGYTKAQQEQYANQLKQQMQAEFLKDLIGKMNDKCFKVKLIMSTK